MRDDDGTKVHVLIAEDEILAAQALQEILGMEGYWVTVGHDGHAALADAEAHPPDALLTDIEMPRLDGLTLIRRLRSTRPSLPVVIMTGNPPPEWTRVVQDDALDHTVLLMKPVSPREIIGAIRTVLAA